MDEEEEMDEAARERCELRARKVMLARGLTGLIIFRPFFFSNGVQFEREKRKNEEGECSIRFDSIRLDSQVLDDKAALTKKNSAEWNQLIGAVLSCGES